MPGHGSQNMGHGSISSLAVDVLSGNVVELLSEPFLGTAALLLESLLDSALLLLFLFFSFDADGAVLPSA